MKSYHTHPSTPPPPPTPHPTPPQPSPLTCVCTTTLAWTCWYLLFLTTGLTGLLAPSLLSRALLWISLILRRFSRPWFLGSEPEGRGGGGGGEGRGGEGRGGEGRGGEEYNSLSLVQSQTNPLLGSISDQPSPGLNPRPTLSYCGPHNTISATLRRGEI